MLAPTAFAADVVVTDNSGAVVDQSAVSTAEQLTATVDDAADEATLAPQPGALLGAGNNALGELGQGDTGNEENFWQSGAAESWTAVSSGNDFSCGIQAPGTLWCWGANGSGQLGLGDVTTRKSPVQVGTATDWTKIALGRIHACGVRADSSLYCWGSGGLGKLGLGDSSSQKSPQKVGTGFTDVSAGVDSTCAIKSGGTAWCWGYGGSGMLGNGGVSSLDEPTQAAGSGYASISVGGYHTCAVKTNGTLWCWGDNNLGEAGVNSLSMQKVPAQVGSATNWKQVSAAYDSTCAVTTVGTLWCWGYGGSGQLGLGDTSLRKVPVQVGSDADWASVSATRYSTCARKTDTSFWCWGYNASGQLGLGDTSKRDTPTQVTTPVTVDLIAAGSTADQTLVVSQDTTPVNACPALPTSQAFAKLGDLADYSLAPSGDFENGTDGWLLKNTTVVSGNETLGITAGSKSLQLGGPKTGGAAEATTPEFCLNETHPSFRYVAKNRSTASGILYTALRFRSKANPNVVVQVSTSATTSSTSWAASEQIPLATKIASSLLKRGGSVQLVLSTSSATANGGGVQVDSLLVDPYRRG
jgi:alpha-tubulin suppressor-like RCC1 family protein